MSSFFPRLLWFLSPLVLVILLMEVSLRSIPNDYIKKENIFTSRNGEIETLILGSSHCLYGLDPKYFDQSSFNLAHVSQTIDIDLAFLNKYLVDLKHLKTIVIRLSYPTLFERLGNTSESWRVKNYNIYYGLDIPNPYFNRTEVFSNDLDVNISRLFNYYIKRESNINCSEYGWGNSFHSSVNNNLERSGIVSSRRHLIEDHQYFQICKNELAEMVSICEGHNIQLILFTPPGYVSYRNLLDERQLMMTVDTGEEFASQSEFCSYYNLLADSSFVEEDFYDADHLNEIGAKKLSLFFNKVIEK